MEGPGISRLGPGFTMAYAKAGAVVVFISRTIRLVAQFDGNQKSYVFNLFDLVLLCHAWVSRGTGFRHHGQG